MFIGGSICSTASGIKIYNIVIVLKSIWWEIQSLFLPKVIKELKTKCVLANNDGKQVVNGAYYYLVKMLKEGK